MISNNWFNSFCTNNLNIRSTSFLAGERLYSNPCGHSSFYDGGAHFIFQMPDMFFCFVVGTYTVLPSYDVAKETVNPKQMEPVFSC